MASGHCVPQHNGCWASLYKHGPNRKRESKGATRHLPDAHTQFPTKQSPASKQTQRSENTWHRSRFAKSRDRYAARGDAKRGIHGLPSPEPAYGKSCRNQTIPRPDASGKRLSAVTQHHQTTLPVEPYQAPDSRTSSRAFSTTEAVAHTSILQFQSF